MREIKFRFWDKHLKTMQMDIQSSYDWEIVNHDKCMQFTGLCDKNGKEIYESDLIIDKSGFCVTVEWSKENLTFQCFGKHRSYRPLLKDIDLNEWKIIGNIHEDKS